MGGVSSVPMFAYLLHRLPFVARAEILVLAGLLLHNCLLALEPGLLALIHQTGRMMGEGASPLSFANILLLANAMAAAAAIMVLMPMGMLRPPKPIKAGSWGWLGATILVSNVATTALLTAALALAPVGNVILIFALQVPLGALLARIFYGERASLGQKFAYGVICIAAGAPLIIDDEIMAGHLLEWGDLLALGAVLCSVYGQFLGKRVSAALPPALAVLGSHLGSLACFLLLALVLFGPTHITDGMDAQVFYLIALYAVLVVNGNRAIQYVIYRHASRLGIVTMSASQPVMAMLFAALLTHQSPSWAHMVGGVLVMAAILVAATGGVRDGTAGSGASVAGRFQAQIK